MNPNQGMNNPQQSRSGTPGGGPKRTSTPSASSADFDLDFLDNISPSSSGGGGGGAANGMNAGQKRLQQQQQPQDILNYLQ